MARQHKRPELRTIVYVDAVNFTKELHDYEHARIAPKINQLKEFVEFFFVHKLQGEIINEMGDGFLILCPADPVEVIKEALSCRSFIAAYNHDKQAPSTLSARIAIHFGPVQPPENGNYIDTNLNYTARLEGATPPGGICISDALHSVVKVLLSDYDVKPLKGDFKGLGQSRFYLVSQQGKQNAQTYRRESQLSFYFATINSFMSAQDPDDPDENAFPWIPIGRTCEHALVDFPDHPEFMSQLAYALLQLNDHIGAIRYFEKCAAVNYKLSDSLYFIARAYEELEQPTEAEQFFHKAAAADATNFHALARLAEISFAKKEFREALRFAKQAAKRAPNYFTPYAIQVAVGLLFKKDEEMKKLVQRMPKFPREHRFFLSDIARYLKDSGARGYKKRLLSLFGSKKRPRRNRRNTTTT